MAMNSAYYVQRTARKAKVAATSAAILWKDVSAPDAVVIGALGPALLTEATGIIGHRA